MINMLIYEQFKTIKRLIPTFDVTVYSGFTNQPTNDGIEVVSGSASDTGYITLWGNTNGDTDIVYEEVKLNGTTAVATSKVNWGNLYGAFMGKADGSNIKAAVGTITIRKATGDLTITTIATTKYSIGMVAFHLPGENVEIYKVTGNLWMNPLTLVSAANGWPCGTTEQVKPLSENGGNIYLISDTAATAKIKVLNIGY
jgi:hypothetical protein